jgi:hypothetical protein
MGISEATSYSKFKHSTNDEMQRPDVAVEGFDIGKFRVGYIRPMYY